MSKKQNRYEEYEDEDNYADYHDDLKERRKLKRMRNALRSKNIDDLLRDYDEYW